MKTSVLEAGSSLSQLVDQVRAGEEIVLTRHGKPVAKVTPVTEDSVPSMDWLALSCAKRFAGNDGH